MGDFIKDAAILAEVEFSSKNEEKYRNWLKDKHTKILILKENIKSIEREINSSKLEDFLQSHYDYRGC